MTDFTNRYRSYTKPVDKDKQMQVKLESLALAEVTMYIEDRLQSCEDEVAPFVKLLEMKKFYCHCLEQLGAVFMTVNATRLKEGILKLNSNLEANFHKKESYISYKDDLAAALEYSGDNSGVSDAVHLSKAEKIVRSEVVQSKLEFTGYFFRNFQVEFVPGTLLSLMHTITGSSYTAPNEVDVDNGLEYYEPALSITQLVSFDTVQKRGGSNNQFRHNVEKETPLSIYIAFLLYSHTRSRSLTDQFCHLELCISYDHMLILSTNLGNSICAQFEEYGVVWPVPLRFNIFSTFAVDSFNQNPSCRTATGSWHGTAISATQHIDSAHDSIQ